jgi:hypothetical protein
MTLSVERGIANRAIPVRRRTLGGGGYVHHCRRDQDGRSSFSEIEEMRLEPFEWVAVVAGTAFAVQAFVNGLDGQIVEAVYDSMFAVYLLYMAAWHFRRRRTGDGGVVVGFVTGIVLSVLGVSVELTAIQRLVDHEQPLWGTLLLACGLGLLLLAALALVSSTLAALGGRREKHSGL